MKLGETQTYMLMNLAIRQETQFVFHELHGYKSQYFGYGTVSPHQE